MKPPSFPVGILLAHELRVTPEYLTFREAGLRKQFGAMNSGDTIAGLERRLLR
jgi:hypothetical protein